MKGENRRWRLHQQEEQNEGGYRRRRLDRQKLQDNQRWRLINGRRRIARFLFKGKECRALEIIILMNETSNESDLF